MVFSLSLCLYTHTDTQLIFIYFEYILYRTYLRGYISFDWLVPFISSSPPIFSLSLFFYLYQLRSLFVSTAVKGLFFYNEAGVYNQQDQPKRRFYFILFFCPLLVDLWGETNFEISHTDGHVCALKVYPQRVERTLWPNQLAHLSVDSGRGCTVYQPFPPFALPYSLDLYFNFYSARGGGPPPQPFFLSLIPVFQQSIYVAVYQI